MSQLAAARGQPRKPLADTTIKVNIPRPLYPSLTHKDPVAPRPAARGSLRLARTRYKNSQDLTSALWTRLRCSPYHARILRVEPYLVDENGCSIMARVPENITPSRSTRSRSRSSRESRSRMASPHTPVKQQGPRNESQWPAAAGANKRVSSSGMTPDVPTPPPKDTPRPKTSPLDKELPAKPALRYAESPQRRGILDAADSAAKRMTVSYPPLRPSNVVRHRPSMSDSSSFKVTPSLKSARGSVKYEVGTASTKKAQKVQGLPVIITSQRTLRQTSSAYSLTAARGSASSNRAVNLSHGHIGAYKNGSPIQRYPSNRRPAAKTPVKFNRRNTRGFVVLHDNLPDKNITVKVDIEQIEENVEVNKKNIDVSRDTLAEDSAEESPIRSDIDRRFVKLGVGPTVRYSKDAREVLMGKSPNVVKPAKKTSSFGAPGKLLNDGPYPRLLTKPDMEVKSCFQVGDAPASRLARPTASSARRTQESKAKIELRKSLVPSEVKKAPEAKKGSKGIRGRVSDLLHGRRRSAQPIVDKSPPPLIHSKKYDVRNITAKDLTLTGEQVDKLASDRDQQQAQADRHETTQAHASTNAPRRLLRNSTLAARRNPNDNSGRPSPPPTNSVESLRARYLEDAAALQTEDARLEAAIAGVQASLDEIITTTQSIEYPGFRGVVEPVIRSLAASILSAQNARVAVVGLGNSTQRVMTDTLLMGEAISRAATQARVMVGEIQTMVPIAEISEAD